MKNKRNTILLIILLAIVASFLFVNNSKNNIKTVAQIKREESLRIKREDLKKLEILRSQLANLSIVANAVSVYDITNKVKIYGENDTVPLPLASLAKTMTALVSLDMGYDSNITISKEALDAEGDYGLLLGEQWKVTDLIKFTLIYSSNDGATELSLKDNNFTNKMNRKSRNIGMKNTLFKNPTGLDEGEETGAYSSAYDANIMAIYALETYPEIFKDTSLPDATFYSLSGVSHKINNTNLILNKIPNVLFSKTGFTNLAGGNLTVVIKNKNNHDVAITILGSSLEGRFVDMEKIINLLYNFNYGN